MYRSIILFSVRFLTPFIITYRQAELKGPQGTPYEDKYFVLKLVFSQDFPSAPPRGFFLTKIYHPNVDVSTGAICVNTLKRDWTADTTLSHVLAVIRCLLIVPFPESSLNDEAGKLFMESYDEYAKRARLMADVHGRMQSISKSATDAKDEDTVDVLTPTVNKSEERGVLQSASDNSSTRTSINAGSVGKSGAVKKGASGKLNKKKSLKRL